jgi:hypothetical protein
MAESTPFQVQMIEKPDRAKCCNLCESVAYRRISFFKQGGPIREFVEDVSLALRSIRGRFGDCGNVVVRKL